MSENRSSTRRRPPLPERPCELASCGKKFQPRRVDQRYHDEDCKKKAYLLRQQEAEKQGGATGPASPPVPQPPKKIVVSKLQDLRRGRNLDRFTLDPVLTLVAEREVVTLMESDPAMRAALERYGQDHDVRIASQVCQASDLAALAVDELIDPRFPSLGVATRRLDGDRVVVAFVISGRKAAA